MAETTAQPKPVSGRRRQTRNSRRPAAQKAYASENDMGVIDMSRYNMTPRTPEKAASGSPASSNKQTNSARQRIKNKNAKQKTAASTSPEPDQPAQHTTPQRPASAKAPNNIAFAGATFHASPAPSALPMPSFFSKTAVGSPSAKDSQGAVQQPSPPATDTDIPTPQRQSVGAKSSDSPLDFMFRAHREEKQRQHQGHNPVADSTATPPTNPSSVPGSFPKASSGPHTRSVPTRIVSSGGIDDEEFGGNYNQPMGPAFSTPYSERIKAARSNHAPPIPGQENHYRNPGASSAEDPTEALKKFLFSGNGQSPPASAPTTARSRPALSESPSAARANEVSRDGHQAGNIQAMEADLKRILKLDVAPATSNAESRLFTQ